MITKKRLELNMTQKEFAEIAAKLEMELSVHLQSFDRKVAEPKVEKKEALE